jgi:hypothetical protein
MKDRSYDEITQSHDAEVQTTQKAEKKTETYTFGGKEYLRDVTPPHQFKTPLELLHYLWREYDCPAAWGVWKEIWSPAGSGRPKGLWREWKGLRVEIHETDAGHHEYQITNGEDIFAQSSRVFNRLPEAVAASFYKWITVSETVPQEVADKWWTEERFPNLQVHAQKMKEEEARDKPELDAARASDAARKSERVK